MLVSVIIPAYNEERTIGQVLEALCPLPIEKQIIVVNDGSTDGTYDALERLRKVHQLTVVHCEENGGKGCAIRNGLTHVQGEAVVIQDADMELSPTDLSELLKPLEQADIQVVTVQDFSTERGNASLHNFIANRVLATYTNLLYGCRITDESTGYKVFSTELITRLNLRCEGLNSVRRLQRKFYAQVIASTRCQFPISPRTKKEGKKLRFWSDGLFAAWTLLKYRFISKSELFKIQRNVNCVSIQFLEVKSSMLLKKAIYSTLILLLIGGLSFSALGHSDLPTLLEDVNKDGVVNIQDLVLVAAAFGQLRDRNATQDPDVNRDGIVNVLDLVRVSNSFGQTVPNENSAYHAIQEYVFDKSCANSVCHAAPANAGNLNLTYGLSYEDLVGGVPQNPAAAVLA